MQRQDLGYVLAALAGCLWSTSGVLGKIVLALGADPLSVLSLRATIAAAVLGVALVVIRPGLLLLRSADIPFFVGYGFVGVALNYIGYFYALKFTTVATAITLLYTYPALVVVFAFFVYGEPITRVKVLALLLSFIGVVLIASGSSPTGLQNDPRGLLFGLLSGISAAVYALSGKRALARYDAKTAAFYSFLFGSLALSALRYVERGTELYADVEIIVLIVAIAIVPTLLGYGIFTYSLSFIEAGRASVISSVEPAIATYLAYLLLGEIPILIQLAGSGLILLGIVTLYVGTKYKGQF